MKKKKTGEGYWEEHRFNSDGTTISIFGDRGAVSVDVGGTEGTELILSDLVRSSCTFTVQALPDRNFRITAWDSAQVRNIFTEAKHWPAFRREVTV